MLLYGSIEVPYLYGPLSGFGLYASYVGPITCISPTDGVPFFQLESHLLTMPTSPPDSCCIRARTAPVRFGPAGSPRSRSAFLIVGVNRVTAPDIGPLYAAGPNLSDAHLPIGPASRSSIPCATPPNAEPSSAFDCSRPFAHSFGASTIFCAQPGIAGFPLPTPPRNGILPPPISK